MSKQPQKFLISFLKVSIRNHIFIKLMHRIDQMLSFFAPLKVSESLCLFCLKISVTVTYKEMIFLSNCPILNL